MSPKSKTALVLAGGGLTGAVYEIGALRAIDDLLIDLSVNDFDIYVGTSAGALISAYLANGVTPEEMLGVIEGTNKEVDALQSQYIFHLSKSDYLHWGLSLPVKLFQTWTSYLRHFYEMTLFDFIWSLGKAMPAGFYDGEGLDFYIQTTLKKMGYTNSFNELSKELYIIATDLDSGDRAIFGVNHLDAPISTAVAASSALPVVYKPVRVRNNEYIDGGFRGTASIDIAIERGAKLIVCINPLVPFNNSNTDQNTASGLEHSHLQEYGHLSEKGFQSVADQTLRIFSHAGLQYHVKQLRRAHPQVDIILIEPQKNDPDMYFYNMMRYSARLTIAHHGFETVTYDLAKDYPYYKEVLSRHGIRISRRLVIEEINEIADSNHDPRVIRKVLEASRIGCKQRNPKNPLCQLSKILADLETILEDQTTAISKFQV